MWKYQGFYKNSTGVWTKTGPARSTRQKADLDVLAARFKALNNKTAVQEVYVSTKTKVK